MIEQIAEVARDKRVEGIVELRDESDRQGIRVVIEIRRDTNPEIVLNQLYRYTPLQTNFAANMLALDRGRPETLTLKSLIKAFVDFRQEVVTRRTRFDLDKARERAEILVGLAAAVANIDAVIALIRAAPDPASARASLMERDWPAEDIAELIALIDDPGRGIVDGRYRLSEAQARAVLELRLQRLTALGRDEIDAELRDIAARIVDYLEILRSRTRLYEVVRGELTEVRDQLATPRRSVVVEAAITQADEDLVQREDMVLTVSHSGYIKRVPLSTYRVQQRGGRGRTGMSTRQADFVAQMFVVDTHTPLLFFSTAGRVYRKKTWMLPAASPQARGKAMVNLLPLAAGETIATLMPCPETRAERAGRHIMFATARGYVRRNSLDDFENIQSVGKIAMKLDPGDRIVAVRICTEDDDVLLSARGGKCLRFRTGDVRLFKGRSSQGVRGMRLAADDEVISMSILRHVELGTGERDAYLRRRREEPGGEAAGDAAPGARRRARGRRGVHPRRHRERLRQAHLGLRVPHDEARRAGHHQHRDIETERPGGQRLPGRGRRPDHADHGRRATDSRRRRGHPCRRPQHPGGDAVQDRRGRAGGLGGLAAGGRGRRRQRRARGPARRGIGGRRGNWYR